MIIIAATNSFQALLIQPAVDQTLFNEHSNSKMLLQIPILIICVTVGKGVSMYYQQVLGTAITTKIINSIRLKVFKSFIRSDIQTFNEGSTARMVSVMLNDVNGMMGAISMLMSGVFKNFFSVIFLLAVMVYMNLKLTLVALIGFPLAAIPIIIVYKRINKYMTQNQLKMEAFTVVADDALRSVKVVKSYNSEEKEIDKLDDALNGLYKLAWRIARVSNIPSPLNETLIGVGTAAVLFYGGSLVMDGSSTPGSFFAFFAALMMAYKPMKSVGGLGAQLQICMICAARVFSHMDKLPKITDKPDAKKLENVKGEIEFKNVSFNYNAEVKALSDISFKLEAGKKYALVGNSGGGKSTVMNLLLRFYDTSSGEILIDGNNIKDVTMRSLRENISYVGQDVQLFDDTILENIRYGKPEASLEEVIEAAKMAEAHEFIEKLPQKYNSKAGQNGQNLSGGQRQRISIARAILRNTPILLLDEATSALDPISEKLIQKALEKLMEGKTSLTIAHRLSTVVNSDTIFVVGSGKIIEQGTHEQLLEQGEHYKSLYATQFK